MPGRVFLIVLDSLGIGEMPDAAQYGDAGSNTLRAVTGSPRFFAPNLARLGLFNIEGVGCGVPETAPAGCFARLAERSRGKDTTIGHWEIAGVVSEQPLPTYPQGFPEEIIVALREKTGRGILCNLPYSGTKVIAEYGRQSVESGALIVYTSADSVLQIAAHEEMIPPEELYAVCRIAREIMRGKHGVGRIIARPFVGEYPNYTRTANRHDFSLPPPSPTLLDALAEAGYEVIGVGKIGDIFAGRGLTRTHPTQNNDDGMRRTLRIAGEDFCGLCFVNLVDFDMLYGHRNDVDGYAAALSAFDRQLAELLPLLREEDLLLITADHGCDPSTPSTDHSREYVPLLATGARLCKGLNLHTRDSFADLSATLLAYFGLPLSTQGSSFLQEILK